MKTIHVFAIGLTSLTIASAITLETYKKNKITKDANRSYAIAENRKPPQNTEDISEKPCVFMTVMGEQSSEGFGEVKHSKEIAQVINSGEKWLTAAQNKDGGWGAGSHNNQSERNPHAVQSDPATTAMSALALCRLGYNINNGQNSQSLKAAVKFLLNEIEKNINNEFITQIRGTQIQSKLGANIDAVLTLQFLNQIVTTINDQTLKERVTVAIQNCVNKIEQSFDKSGRVSGAGWAGVLQSSFANSALEDAQKNKNIRVNKDKIETSRNYQKSNFDTKSDRAKTEDGAGVMLYAVSSSVRGSAAEAREANDHFEQAKASGKIDKNAVMTEENLIATGVSAAKASSFVIANKVYGQAKAQAMDNNVMEGFGNNGGEEFMSFLQTGESMLVKNDNDWRKWYDNVSGKMMKIQNQDGSWNGHHCITSPAFCTAVSLLILSIENDFSKLQKK